MLGLILAQEESTARGLEGWELALAAGLTVFATGLTLWFLFLFFRHIGQGTFMGNTVRQWIDELKPEPDTVAAVVDEFLARRYEFLTFYGQFIVTTLVITAITMLLLTGAVESDAGLPLLATVLGIVLAKTVLTRRSLPERPAELEGGPGPSGNGAAANGAAVAEEEIVVDEELPPEEEYEGNEEPPAGEAVPEDEAVAEEPTPGERTDG